MTCCGVKNEKSFTSKFYSNLLLGINFTLFIVQVDYYNHYYYWEIFFHIIFSWWLFTRVWVIASLLRSPGHCSEFWRFPVILVFELSPLILQTPITPFPSIFLVTVAKASITIGIIITFIFHSFFFFAISWQGRGTYHSFHFLSVSFCGHSVIRDNHNSASSLFFFFFIIIRCGLLAEIK